MNSSEVVQQYGFFFLLPMPCQALFLALGSQEKISELRGEVRVCPQRRSA